MFFRRKSRERQALRRSVPFSRAKRAAWTLRLHPLFWLVGVWYCIIGKLPLFFISCLIAVQHECAHAFAAAKLGYRLNKIVLMPFGAVIDGDLRALALKDEICVAAWGPLCNLLTAGFFGALWWFVPTMYAYTDTAFYSSLSIACINLLPAYPLDGGRILQCVLVRALVKTRTQTAAERLAGGVCRIVTLAFAAVFTTLFFVVAVRGVINYTLLTFGGFLLVGGLGNRDKNAVYNRMDFSSKNALERGVELKRVALLHTCPIKQVLRHITRGAYLVIEVYDEAENHLFDLPQNEFSKLFLSAPSPYTTLQELAFIKKATQAGKALEKFV